MFLIASILLYQTPKPTPNPTPVPTPTPRMFVEIPIFFKKSHIHRTTEPTLTLAMTTKTSFSSYTILSSSSLSASLVTTTTPMETTTRSSVSSSSTSVDQSLLDTSLHSSSSTASMVLSSATTVLSTPMIESSVRLLSGHSDSHNINLLDYQ